LIAPLDSRGQSPHCRPLQKNRVIDLRAGDLIWHRGRCYYVESVEAYREARVDPQGTGNEQRTEGYLVRGS